MRQDIANAISPRPPAGVTLIGSACLVASGIQLATALLCAVAPSVLRAYGFPDLSKATARFGLTTVLTVSAVLLFAAGYDLLRLREWTRRTLICVLVVLAISDASGLLGESLPLRLTAFIAIAGGAVYLARPAVKAAFDRRGNVAR